MSNITKELLMGVATGLQKRDARVSIGYMEQGQRKRLVGHIHSVENDNIVLNASNIGIVHIDGNELTSVGDADALGE
jgi:hypothetical protein